MVMAIRLATRLAAKVAEDEAVIIAGTVARPSAPPARYVGYLLSMILSENR
jgi:hypothetical protein